MDHIYPPFEPEDGPIFEAFMAMARHRRADHEAVDQRDGRLQHVSQPGAAHQDGDHARPHQRRPGHPRRRRRLGRARASRLRLRVRAPASVSGCAGCGRPCRSCAACSTAPGPRSTGPHYQIVNAHNVPPPVQAAHAHPHRRQRPQGHAAPGGRVRRHLQHRRLAFQGGRAGRRAHRALRGGRPRREDHRAQHRRGRAHHP